MNDVLMIVHTMGNLSQSDNDRFTCIAKMLINAGKEVEIVTSDFDHHKKKHRDLCKIESFNFKITFLHETAYKKNVSLQRIKGHIFFAKELRNYFKKRKKPDVIYCAVPPLTSAAFTAKYAKKNGIRFIVDIQDLWPEGFYHILSQAWIMKVICYPIKMLADKIYKSADNIIAVSNTYCQRAAEKNKKANQLVAYLGTSSTLVDSVKDCSDRHKNELWIVYIGNLGNAYDFDNLFRALKIIAETTKIKLRLKILGDGNLREKVEILRDTYFRNTDFYGYLPYSEMFYILKQCDIAVNPIKKGVANSVINKVGDYAAAGIPVINTQECSEYRKLVIEYNVGFNVEPENSVDFAEKIKILADNPELRKVMGNNHRKLYYDFFDRDKTYKKIIDTIVFNDNVN